MKPLTSAPEDSLELLRTHGQVLQLMARNRPMQEVTDAIVHLIERFSGGCLSTAYFVEDGKLKLASAPSWDEAFVKAVDGCPIGINHGTCGHAAATGTRAVSLDVATDEVWGPYRDWIMTYGIRSAWSTPVHDVNGDVLATVSMCWKDHREPSAWDFEVVETALKLMTIAVERKRHENLIIDQRLKLSATAKLAAIGEMAANLAHEINTPLAVIQAHVDQITLLTERGNLAPEMISRCTSVVSRTVDRISTIVRGLKRLSRGEDQESLQMVTLRSVIDDTLSLCTERFQHHGIRIRVDLEDENLCVPARPVQLAQVILNLLNNSFDAISSLEERWIQIRVQRNEGHCVLSVTDSGRGIDLKLREKVMVPFFTTKSSHHGTGLGLSISRQIIEAHGGNLSLDEDSRNTRFNVILPFEKGR